MNTPRITIAIDGFSSCGKSTMAKELARRIGYIYIDSGAMYRAITLYCLNNNLINDKQVDTAQLAAAMEHLKITFATHPQTGRQETFLCGECVEKEIRSMRVSEHVSLVSQIDFVRSALVAQQRTMGAAKGIVMDGRDIGTAVFPNAELKIFVVASARVRAERRAAEMHDADIDAIERNIAMRDEMDMTRAISPLRKAHDAIELDNSHMTIAEQDEWLMQRYNETIERLKNHPRTIVEIDSNSGFCNGVVRAIQAAEQELEKGGQLYCLGDIVHNSNEVERLRAKGLITIDHEQLRTLRNVRVLLRAHGEPPETYRIARENNIEIIDATCPVVLQLQRKIKRSHDTRSHASDQILIYGKVGHAEVNGLVGQTNGEAIVLESSNDLDKVDFDKRITLYSQTTKSVEHFAEMVQIIKERTEPDNFEWHDTICRQVANRIPNIREFARKHDLVLFVCGKKSSNGKVLYEECRSVNEETHLVSDIDELNPEWIVGKNNIGICGATSTPRWLMTQFQERVEELLAKQTGH